jgi:hypothetical protein
VNRESSETLAEERVRHWQRAGQSLEADSGSAGRGGLGIEAEEDKLGQARTRQKVEVQSVGRLLSSPSQRRQLLQTVSAHAEPSNTLKLHSPSRKTSRLAEGYSSGFRHA